MNWEGHVAGLDLLAGPEPKPCGAGFPTGSRSILAPWFERQDAARTGRQDICPTGSWRGKTSKIWTRVGAMNLKCVNRSESSQALSGSWVGKTSKNWTRIGAMNLLELGSSRCRAA